MRKPWPQFFMELAQKVAAQSTCKRRQIGAVAVDPSTKRVLALGFNGAPPKVRHCSETSCYRQDRLIPSGQREELCFAVHAEQNLVATAARFGVSLAGSHVFVLARPCITCLKLLVSAGVEKVYFLEDYPVDPDLYQTILEQSGIKVVPLDPVFYPEDCHA